MKTIYILDDGNRPEVQALATNYRCQYLTRPDAALKRYKAANLNWGLTHSYAPFILTIDADTLTSPTILDDLLGHFQQDPKLGLVASRQGFDVPSDDFNHDNLFYDHMQAGKNADGVAISCGTGVIYRRSALDAIGGFSEWNLVEDMHTSYAMNGAGYHTKYTTQSYSFGFAPTDLKGIYKQRGAWAVDTMRIFFWQQPLFNFKLSFRQRLHWLEIAYAYLTSGVFLPIIYFFNIYTLFTDRAMITGGWWYVVVRLPVMVLSVRYFGQMSRGQSVARMWAGLFPLYFMGVVKALFYPRSKPGYRVTHKGYQNGGLLLALPQIVLVSLGLWGVFFHEVTYGIDNIFLASTFWMLVMTYWMAPVIMKVLRSINYTYWKKTKGDAQWLGQS